MIIMAKHTKGEIYRLGLGDSVELISENLDPNSVHAIVTDPPY